MVHVTGWLPEMLAAGFATETTHLDGSVEIDALRVDLNPLLGLRRLPSIPTSLAQSNYFDGRSYIFHLVGLVDLLHILPRSPDKPH